MFAPTGFVPVSALFEKIPAEIFDWLSEYKPELEKNYWYTHQDIVEMFLFDVIKDNIFVICPIKGVPHRVFSNQILMLYKPLTVWAMDIQRAVNDEDMLANYKASRLRSAARRLHRENKLNYNLPKIWKATLEQKEEYIKQNNAFKKFNTVQPFIDRRSYSLSKKAFKASQVLDEFTTSFVSDSEFLLKHFGGCPLAIEQAFFDEFWNKRFQSILSNLKGDPDKAKVGPITGRPRKRDLIAESYKVKFPKGHEPMTWKEVCLEISSELGATVTVDTLKRGLGLKG